MHHTSTIFFISLLLVLPSFSQTLSGFFSTEQKGTGTYYGATTGGNCGFSTLIPSFTSSLTQVAINSADYAAADLSQACGMCLSMKGTGSGSGTSPISTTAFTAFVQDNCPSCASGGIDIAKSGSGAWAIEWIAVPCPVGSYKLHYQFQGSNSYYIKVQVLGHALPITAVSFVVGGKTYTSTRTQDNFWNPESSMPTPYAYPMEVIVTAYNGATVTDSIPSMTNGVAIAGSKGVQFSTTAAETQDGDATVGNMELPVAAIAGIAVGCVVLLVGIIVFVVLARRSRAEEHV
jgi:expansin (peptidoglycan-binding protein)